MPHPPHASTPVDGAIANPPPSAPGLLSTIVYHSRAAHALSGLDLLNLAQAAQVRNRTESITGLMLYDNQHFFQWLEGPSEALSRVMGSIRHDPRHTQIEVLNDQPIAQRRFGDWSMKLATSARRAPEWKHEVIKPPRAIIENIRRDPDAAPTLLVKLAPSSQAAPKTGRLAADAVSHAIAGERIRSVLGTLLISAVVPELAAKRRLEQGLQDASSPVDKRAHALAQLLITSDHSAALAFINEACGSQHPLRLYATLFEPAARHLGDLFRDDLCSEFDVTLGLSQLQTAIRMQGAGHLPQSREPLAAPAVLVVPEPGELHALSAVLDAEVLWNGGWAPRCEYPARDEALQELLATTWFDAVDLSLSAALCREHWLPRLTKTIRRARRASRNPALVIVVSGRIFAEQSDACGRVGADRAIPSALHIKREILRALTSLQISRLH